MFFYFPKIDIPRGNFVLQKKGFGTAKLGLIYELIEDSHGENPRVVPSAGVEPTSPGSKPGILSVERQGHFLKPPNQSRVCVGRPGIEPGTLSLRGICSTS